MTGPARCLLQLNSGGKATGARAESEGAAHVFDFPTRPRCVDVHVIVSDAVKGSHIQRSPLSMGGLCELGAVACSRHKKNIAELIMRKNAPLRKRSCATLGTSLPTPVYYFLGVVGCGHRHRMAVAGQCSPFTGKKWYIPLFD
jgi:hypothetical protein